VTSKEHPGLSAARRMLGARKGPPTEADSPRRESRPPRVLPGQIDVYGVTHGLDEDAYREQRELERAEALDEQQRLDEERRATPAAEERQEGEH
jgi:hypothetical protein